MQPLQQALCWTAEPFAEGAMKSAIECFQHAERCEEQPFQIPNDDGRAILHQIAKVWRALGEQAKANETAAAQEATK
jgi:hypothetical protein